MNYEATCREATTLQGLDDVVEHLRATGYVVEVEQTGGFTMVPTIYLDEKHAKAVGISNEDGYLVVFYDYSDEMDEGLVWASRISHVSGVVDVLTGHGIVPNQAKLTE